MEEDVEIIQELGQQTDGRGQREKPKDEQFHFDCKRKKKLIHFIVTHHTTHHMWSVGVARAGLA